MKAAIHRLLLFSLIFFVAIAFQNCGGPVSQTQNLFLESSSGGGDCLSEVVDCGPNSDYLEITLDLANPLILNPEQPEFSFSGRCNPGNFPEHILQVSYLSAFNDVLATQNFFDECHRGVYSISMDTSTLVLNTNYSLRVQIIGVLDGNYYVTDRSNGDAEIDFSLQEPAVSTSEAGGDDGVVGESI